MSKKQSKKQRRSQPLPLLILIGAGVILIVAAIWLTLPKVDGQPDQMGTPAITVNQEKIDFGEVKLDTPLTFEFNVTNTGNGTLRFTEAPYIEVVEGC